MTVTVQQAACHDTCLDVIGPEDHVANVNPVGETDPVQWRVDCDSCFTCIQAGFASKEAARDAAIAHVKTSSDDHWAERDIEELKELLES